MARIAFPDRSAATRPVIAVDGEGWNIPLTDGEVSVNDIVNERGWHSYVMLAGADDRGSDPWTLVHDWSRAEADPENGIARNYGLDTARVLDFLLDLPREALKVGFYFSYDVEKLLADLPEQNLRELADEGRLPDDPEKRRQKEARKVMRTRRLISNYGLTIGEIERKGWAGGNCTLWEGYLIKYIPRKEFSVWDLRAGKEVNPFEKDGRKQWKRTVTVYDVFGFFQKSFVAALRDYRCNTCESCRRAAEKYACGSCEACEAHNQCELTWCTNICTPADIKRIADMKEQRGVFTPDKQAEILSYCVSECRFLAGLFRDLIVHVESLELSVRAWNGSGAVAQAWMKREKIPDMRDRMEYDADREEITYSGLPESVMLGAYFGGRFEITTMGPIGDLWSYDINSAYPAIAQYLPCLAHGSFVHVDRFIPDAIGVYRVGSLTIDHPRGDYFAPFPFRANEDMAGIPSVGAGSVFYAHGGQRWIWQAEVAAAQQHFGPERIPVYEGWVWVPECDHKPFEKIPEMYALRQQMVADRNGAEKIIKLIINSVYGKTAQSIGWGWDRELGRPKRPDTQCFTWAGLITSGCRAMILDAVMRGDVVSIATDGILSRTPIDLYAPDQKILGAWEAKEVQEAWLFQSGVYTMVNRKGQRTYKTRGFSAREIGHEDLINAWNEGRTTVSTRAGQTRFVSSKSGLGRTNPAEYIGQWIPSEHDIRFEQTRREPLYEYDERGMPIWTKLTPHSRPYAFPNDVMSGPYIPKESWEDVRESQGVYEGDYFEWEPAPELIEYSELVES